MKNITTLSRGIRRLPMNCAKQQFVAQVSKPAVSPISKSAARENVENTGLTDAPRVWKPAIQQTWRSALHSNKPFLGRLKLATPFAGLLAVLLLAAPSFAQETRRLYLSGHGKDDAVPWKFLCTTGACSGVWTNLPVPSQWDMHGFGSLTYKKDATNAWDEKGLYEHIFSVPAAWSGQRVFLVFDGAMTDTSTSINGRSAGPMHQGGFYRFKYEITPLVRLGSTNLLEVTVARHSANNSINKAERLADYWVFGGIYRPVYLEAVPPQFIDRVAIDARADGSFTADVFVDGRSDAETVEAQIMTLDGGKVGEPFSGALDKTAASTNGLASLRLQTRVTSPRQWTAETPNLYSVEFRLKRGAQILHQHPQRFGFRTLEVRDGDGFYVNGRRVILKGVNRHSFWPDSGRCLSEAVHRLDIQTMKDMNMNAVRMSHYPPDEQFLDLCDESGLYVLDELAGWHNYYDTETGTRLVREMVTRDVNHPSILFWDNGNEGGFNTNLDAVFPAFDPQRRRVLHPWMAFNGVNTAHYLVYDEAAIATAGIPIYYHPNGKTFAETNDTAKYIYMPTEFMHGLFDGGAGAGLEDYWKLMTSGKSLGGGFIWVLTDDGVKRPDTGQIDTAGNQAPDGIVGPYRQREGSFYSIKQIWSPIQVRWTSNDAFAVENHYSFTDANRCKFTWQLRRFQRPSQSQDGFSILKEGVIPSPSIPPGGAGTLPFNLPQEQTDADALALRVEDPSGRELWTWVWPLSHFTGNPIPPAKPGRNPVTCVEGTDAFTLTADSLIVRFDKRTGMLASVQEHGRTFSLSNGPRPASGQLGALVGIKTDTKKDGSAAFIRMQFDGDLRSVTWTVRGDGWVQCEYSYFALGTNEFLGVQFDYPENQVKCKRWLGEGPYRVWKNRMTGTTLNVWQNDYNNTITGWRDWIYPEFKGCFAGVRWMQLTTTEGPITLVPAHAGGFVQVLTPEFPPTNTVGKTFLTLPRAGLALLDAIPAVGTKFKEASTTGPQGQPNVARGEYTGSVSLFFGKLP